MTPSKRKSFKNIPLNQIILENNNVITIPNSNYDLTDFERIPTLREGERPPTNDVSIIKEENAQSRNATSIPSVSEMKPSLMTNTFKTDDAEAHRTAFVD